MSYETIGKALLGDTGKYAFATHKGVIDGKMVYWFTITNMRNGSIEFYDDINESLFKLLKKTINDANLEGKKI